MILFDSNTNYICDKCNEINKSIENDIMRNAFLQHREWELLVIDNGLNFFSKLNKALVTFKFNKKSVLISHTSSLAEAKELMDNKSNYTMVIIITSSGTSNEIKEIIGYIRNVLHNKFIQIVLISDTSVSSNDTNFFIEADINGYYIKKDFINNAYMYISMLLRSFKNLISIDNSKKGLEKIIEASSTIFGYQSINKFAQSILTQMGMIIQLNNNTSFINSSGFIVTKLSEDFSILAAEGKYNRCIGKSINRVVNESILSELKDVYLKKTSKYLDDHFIVYFNNKDYSENMIYYEGTGKINKLTKYLINIFCTNISIAFDNIYLNREIEQTQKEIIFTLGEISEARSKETGNHVKRVAEYSKLLALKCGLSEIDSETIRMASPMHDVGKLAIPDSILNKPDKLTDKEFDIMKTHAKIGYDMLKKSNKRLMKTAAIIALEHHEKFDGTGYPFGLKGDEIHIFGRITALADVFDALGSKRVYKSPWQLDTILSFFMEESGRHFDPLLVKIFFDNLDEILKIRTMLSDF